MKFNLTTIAAAVMLSTTAVASEDMEGIERITVDGQYLSINESNSIKTPTPILDVPQSLSIMTAEEITLRSINSVRQIIDYTPGVNTSAGEGHRDSVVFRGVRSTADFYLDGNRDDVQYYRALYNVEQVEILRGPNALLFGRGGTGGILNRVSKKASLGKEFTNYQVSLDSFSGYSGQLDTNVSTGDKSAVRLNVMREHLENHRDFFDGERYGFNPTARIELSDDTMLDMSYEYADHKRFIDRGIVTDSNGRPVETLQKVVFGDPENNFHNLEAHVLRANLEHRFNDELKGNFNAVYGDYDKVYSNFYAAGYNDETNVATLDGYIDTTQRDSLTLSGNLVGEFQTGNIGHTVIFGAEYIKTNSNQDRFNPTFSTKLSLLATGAEGVALDREDFIAIRSLSINGAKGANANGQSFVVPFNRLNDDTHVQLDVSSLYIQDEIEISEKLDIVLGARFDSFDISVDSFGRSGDPNNNVNGDVVFNENRSRTDEEISPRLGVIYKPQENISVYASYSESFQPRSGEQYANINGNNSALDPNTFTNQEIGLKWDFVKGLSLTAAIFENEQSSPQVADNDPSTLDVIDSQIDGFEIQLTGQLTDRWSINANYSNLDGEIVDRNGATGRTPREVPENTFSVWSMHQLTENYGLGFGATYQDESFINNGNSATLPSYTRIDMAAFYNISETTRVQVNIENLFDELYFPNAHSTHQVTVGEGMNASLSLVGSF